MSDPAKHRTAATFGEMRRVAQLLQAGTVLGDLDNDLDMIHWMTGKVAERSAWTIFVCYSHADKKHLERLKVHLQPFERAGHLDLWSDERIKPAQDWKNEIKAAIHRAGVAVLLLSADFLASEFIAENELPPLLQKAEEEGLRIIQILLSPCAWEEHHDLRRRELVERRPLSEMRLHNKEDTWKRAAKCIGEAARSLAVQGTSVTPGPVLRPSSVAKIPPPVLQEVIERPGTVDEYLVYRYEHLDDLSYMRSAASALVGMQNSEEVLIRVRNLLLNAGWEGDGTLQLCWLPPFTGAGVEDTYGVVLWHVKQENNGTSWIASPVPLPFGRLLAYNTEAIQGRVWRGRIDTDRYDVEDFLDQLRRLSHVSFYNWTPVAGERARFEVLLTDAIPEATLVAILAEYGGYLDGAQ